MVRYFYSWTPLAIITSVVLLSLPWLGLIAAMIVALAALAALAWATVYMPYVAMRAISRRWQGWSVARPQTAAALQPAYSPQPALRLYADAAAAVVPNSAVVREL
jgi:hypothetical protein